MFKKRFLTIAIVFAIMLSLSAFALDGALEGISAESPVYTGYNACVDSCENCADNCRFNAYRMAAEIGSNEELCKQLPEDMKEMCINRIYALKAASAKDSLLCEKISLKEEKNMCLLNVQIEKAISIKDETECSSAPAGLENACAYAYNMRQALERGDASNCEKTGEERLGANCNASMGKEGVDSYKKQCKYKSARIISKIPIIVLLAAIILIIAIASQKKQNKKPAKKKRL